MCAIIPPQPHFRCVALACSTKGSGTLLELERFYRKASDTAVYIVRGSVQYLHVLHSAGAPLAMSEEKTTTRSARGIYI